MVFRKSFNFSNDFRIYCDIDIPLYISDVSIHIDKKDIVSNKQYITDEVYMLTDNNYTNIKNWVKINK